MKDCTGQERTPNRTFLVGSKKRIEEYAASAWFLTDEEPSLFIPQNTSCCINKCDPRPRNKLQLFFSFRTIGYFILIHSSKSNLLLAIILSSLMHSLHDFMTRVSNHFALRSKRHHGKTESNNAGDLKRVSQKNG